MLKQLFSPIGSIGRVGFLVTHVVAALVEAFVIFALASSRQAFSPDSYYLITVAATIPFVWVQVSVTLRRLATLEWHAVLALPMVPASLWPLWGVLGLAVSSIAGLALVLSASYFAGLAVLLTTYERGERVSPATPDLPTPPQPVDATVTCRNGHLYPADAGGCPFCDARIQPRPVEPPVPVVNPDRIVGWLVVIDGPDRGTDLRLLAGTTRLGSEPSRVLSPVDLEESPQEHAVIVFDPVSSTCALRAGSGPIAVNGAAATDRQLRIYDRIQIGHTTMLFVPFAGRYHRWDDSANPPDAGRSIRAASLTALDGGRASRLVETSKWDETVDLALADGVLVPAEAQLVIGRAGVFGLTERDARDRLLRRLADSKFQPVTAGRDPLGAAHPDPFSVSWAAPASQQRVPPEAAPPISGASRPRRAGLIVSALAAFVVAGTAFAMVPQLMSSISLTPAPHVSPDPTPSPAPPVVDPPRPDVPDGPPQGSNPPPVVRPEPPIGKPLRPQPPPQVVVKKDEPPTPQLKKDVVNQAPPGTAPGPVPFDVDVPPKVTPAVPPPTPPPTPPAPEPAPPEPPPPAVATTPEPRPYTGPMFGTLTCSGAPIVQNAEVVFRNLPPGRLQLTVDDDVWEARLSPSEGNTQRLILRNRKPGVQRKCAVTWRVVP